MNEKKIALSIVFIMLFSSFAIANVINVPEDQLTIQGGINAAIDGDTVLVHPDTYVENINYNGKNITVASLFLTTGDTSYISQTIIDGNQNWSVVVFQNGENSTATLCGFTITNGTGYLSLGCTFGGGILCRWSSNPTLKNLIVAGNTAYDGGGISCWNNSGLNLNNVTITNNQAYYGGGISCWDSSSLNFDPNNRCNIYFNNAGCGTELYLASNITLLVDTFTVLQPDDYHIYPIENCNFDILQGKVEQVESDLYVSPTGDNNNSGTSPASPLQTIYFALSKILVDSLHPHTIYLDTGTYSFSGSGEFFPLNCRSYVSIIGEEEETTILDGENNRGILFCDDNNFFIENLTIRNGCADVGGGVFFYNSNPTLCNVTIENNMAYYGGGGGIYCRGFPYPSLINVTITNNSALGDFGGGIRCYDSSPILSNSIISNNSAGSGGGIHCEGNSNPNFNTVIITGNSVSMDGGGISCGNNSCPKFINVTVTNNSADNNGGGIYCWYSKPSLINCIVSNNAGNYGIYNNPTNPFKPFITYSDFWNNEEGNFYNCGDSVGINVTTNNNSDSCDIYYNIQLDPLFTNITNGDFHLTEGSPCIDAGNPDTTGLNLPEFDLDGNPRIYNGIIDMGAYEWQGVGIDDWHTPSRCARLYQNYPNPFSGSTTIFFNIHYRNTENAEIRIYNVKGQLVRQLSIIPDKYRDQSSIKWNGKDEKGNTLSSGIYLYKLIVDNNTIDTKKCLLLR